MAKRLNEAKPKTVRLTATYGGDEYEFYMRDMSYIERIKTVEDLKQKGTNLYETALTISLLICLSEDGDRVAYDDVLKYPSDLITAIINAIAEATQKKN